jgi:hypothetical protein
MNTTKDCILLYIFCIDYTSCIQTSCGKKSKKKQDFTEINKLLANGKHFQNEETDSAYYYQQSKKCRRNKKRYFKNY